MRIQGWLLVACFALAACGGEEGSSGARGTSPSTKASAPATQAPNGSIKPSSITWTAPAQLTLVPSRPMYLATYQIPAASGDAEGGELTVSQVGGGAQANIDRWKGQFEGATERETTETTVGDFKVTIVWFEGAYRGMAMPGKPAAGPKADYALLGAVVERPGHGDPHFFKATGPKKTIEGLRPAFDELVQSVAPKS
jgi:hypothetical protein